MPAVTIPARLYLAVGLGAMLGSVARSTTGLGMLALLGPGFPWGTLTVNTLGSLLIGLYAALSAPGGRLAGGAATRQFVMTGFCGGFTTFSIFSLETLQLVQGHHYGLAAINVAGSVCLWLLAVWLGYRVGSRLQRRP